MMIEVLLNSGVWAEVFRDENLDTDGLAEIATDSNLIIGTLFVANLPNRTTVDCSKIIAMRIND